MKSAMLALIVAVIAVSTVGGIYAAGGTGNNGQGLKWPEDTPVTPEYVRDYTIEYLRDVKGVRNLPDPLSASWTGGNETPERLLGASTYVYRADDTVITLSFPIVLPENTVYTIGVESQGGMVWQGQLFQGQFTEQSSSGTSTAS